jgi:hypothetical protein
MAKFSSRDIVVTLTANGKQKIIKDLHMEAETLRTLSGAPNTCTLTIFNLNQESRELLTSLYDNNGNTNMTAEVMDGSEVFFYGDVVNATSVFKDATWMTNIYVNEGYNEYRATIKKTFERGKTREDIIKETIKEATGFFVSIIPGGESGCSDKSIAKKIFANGNVFENVKKFINDCLPDGGDVFVDGDEVVVLPKGSTRAYSEKFTDFLEPPIINEVGAQCKVLMKPGVKVGGTMTLEAKSYNRSFGNLTTNRATKSRFSGEGTYKIIEAIDKVDNYTEKVAMTQIKGIFIEK